MNQPRRWWSHIALRSLTGSSWNPSIIELRQGYLYPSCDSTPSHLRTLSGACRPTRKVASLTNFGSVNYRPSQRRELHGNRRDENTVVGERFTLITLPSIPHDAKLELAPVSQQWCKDKAWLKGHCVAAKMNYLVHKLQSSARLSKYWIQTHFLKY